MLNPYRVLPTPVARLLRHLGDLWLEVARSPETARATAVTRVDVGRSNATRYMDLIPTNIKAPVRS